MAFLFKSKKNQQQQGTSLPPATRNVHTSEGAPSASPPALNGSIKDRDGLSQTPTPSSSYNNSLSSINPNSPDQQRLRQRAESESQIQRPPPQAMNGTATSPSATSPNASLYPWTHRRINFSSSQMNPFPRYGAAINSLASKEGDIYMMGGLIDGATVKGDLWMVESSGGNLSCVPVVTVSEGPGPRVGHASLLVGNAFIVFGGDTKIDENDALDDTLYLLNTSSRQWSRAIPPGTRPSGRYGHTLNILGSRIYVFGGQVEGFFFNDLAAFDLNQLQNPNNKWEFLIRNSHDGGPAPGEIPPARTNHSIVSYNDRLYLFGGTNGVQWFSDVWCYDPRANQWSQLDCVGFIPTPREGHAAALVSDVMYVFGGRTDEGMDLGDLAAFRISTRRWYSFQNMGPAPSPRSGHSMTAFGKQVIVMAGEPSSAPRDPVELSMAYVLDTGKIRYPVEAQNTGTAGPGMRKMSVDKNSPTGRTSREAQNHIPVEQQQQVQQQPKRGPVPSREMVASPNGRPTEQGPSPGPGSRLPRASIAQAPSGPPPPGQAPTPGPRGPGPQPIINPRSKTPTKPERGYASPPMEAMRSMGPERGGESPAARETSKEFKPVSQEFTPVAQEQQVAAPAPGDRRTPTQQQSRMSAKAMEAGEAAPLISAPARQRSLRQRQRTSLDSTDESILGRQASIDGSIDSRSLRNSKTGAGTSTGTGDEPRSPKLTPHQEVLMKELDAAKSRNAWYASELALAKKSGYSPSQSGNSVNDRTPDMFSDEDRPLIEAFLAMRAELAKMQATVDRQAAIASKRVAEVEHQRDLAVNEAAYSRAKLAAHGGSQRGTPQPDASAQDPDGTISERGTDISRRLAMVLAAHAEVSAKLETMTTELGQEKQTRELAEETSEATRKRLAELEVQTNSLEIESLRADLHQAEAAAREESLLRSQAETALKQITFDKEELSRKFEESSTRLRDYGGNLGTLKEAVAASTGKTTLIEKQLDEEREIREGLERKLLQLRSEHDEQTADLDNATRRLRDAEELARSHAKEAETHKIAFLSGLERASSFDLENTTRSVADQRVEALESHVARANELAKANQVAADQSTDKLRRAEERIAGLEAYQEQASREGLQLRRQLQTVMKESQAAATENRELKSQLENNQRDAGALAIQHSALKDLLGERGSSASDTQRSPRLDSPGSRYGTPEQGRLRELEQQLSANLKSHDEMKVFFETREQESDRAYREKLEQLENDYQSAVHYVKGTEKMLKRMKDELARYKAQSVKMQSELDASRQETERSRLNQSMSDLDQDTNASIANLERQVAQLKTDLASAEEVKDKSRSEYSSMQQQLSAFADRARSELEQLKQENNLLETRASDAEQKVTMLLDQVENSVGHYRRQSQHGGQGPNGILRTHSNASSNTIGRTRADSNVSQDDPSFPDNRGSMALDSLANELEALRTHWESTNNYRLSTQSDIDRTPTKEMHDGGGLSDSLAEWRRRLDDDTSSRAESPVAGTADRGKPSKPGDGMDTTNMI